MKTIHEETPNQSYITIPIEQSDRTTTPEYIEGADNRRRLFVTSENLPMEPKTFQQEIDEDVLWDEHDCNQTMKQKISSKHKETYVEPGLYPEKQSEKYTSEVHNQASDKSIILGDISNIGINDQQMQKSFSSLLRLQNTARTPKDQYKCEDEQILESPLKKDINFCKFNSVDRQGPLNSSSIMKTRNQTNKPKLTKDTMNKFQISLLVKRFINKMVNRSTTFVFRNVSSGNPFKLLVDPTYSYQDYHRQQRHNQQRAGRFMTIFLTESNEIMSRLSTFGTINPDSTGKFIFDLIAFLLILFNIIYLPIKFSFSQEIGTFGQGYVEKITLEFLLAEIIVSMSTQYYERALIVKDRILVAKNYFVTRFWQNKRKENRRIDVLVGVPLTISVMSTDQSYLNLFYLIRVLDFIDIFNVLEKMFQSRNQLGDSLKCILLIFFVAHLSACSIHYISTLSDNESTYLDLLTVDKTNWFQVYVYSFYWSIITMTTIGYGDIRPNSHRERMYVTLFAVLSCVVFGFTLNQIGSIMSNIYTSSAQFRRRQAIIDRFLKRRKVTPQLQVMIRKNLEYAYNDNDEESKMVKTIVSGLTSSIREQLQTELYQRILDTSKTFKQNFSKQFIKELSLFFQEEIVSQEEYIFDQRDKPDKLFYIIRGEIEILIKDRKCPITVGVSNNKRFTQMKREDLSYFIQKNTVNHLKQPFFECFLLKKKGELLGLEEFFSQHQYDIQAKTSRVTAIAFLSYSDFISLLAKYPIDNETYKMIYDTQNNQGRSGRLTTKCYNCANQFHQVTKCPYLFLNIDRNLTLGKLIFQRKNDKIFPPSIKLDRKLQKTNAYKHQINIWEAVFKIYTNLDDFADYIYGRHPLDSSDILEDDSQAEIDENQSDQSSEDSIEEPSESDDENLMTNQSKKEQLKKKRRKSNVNGVDLAAGTGISPEQNLLFRTLKIELDKQGLTQFPINSMDKHNPLLQQFFGGQDPQNYQENISKIEQNEQQLLKVENLNNMKNNGNISSDLNSNINSDQNDKSNNIFSHFKGQNNNVINQNISPNNDHHNNNLGQQQGSETSLHLHQEAEATPQNKGTTLNSETNLSKKQLSFGIQPTPLLLVPNNNEQQPEHIPPGSFFNKTNSESNNPRNFNFPSKKTAEKNQEDDLNVPQIAASQQNNFMLTPSVLSSVSQTQKIDANQISGINQISNKQTASMQLFFNEELLASPSPSPQLQQPLPSDLSHQENGILFIQDKNGEPVTPIKGDTNTTHLLSQSDLQFDLVIDDHRNIINGPSQKMKNFNNPQTSSSHLNLFGDLLQPQQSQQKLDSSLLEKDNQCNNTQTEGSNYFKDILKNNDVNMSQESSVNKQQQLKEQQQQQLQDQTSLKQEQGEQQQQQILEKQLTQKEQQFQRLQSAKKESIASVKITQQSSGKTNSSLTQQQQPQANNIIISNSKNPQKLNNLPFLTLTHRISQGLTDMQQHQLQGSSINPNQDNPIRVKNPSSIKKTSQENHPPSQISSPTRSQKQKKTFLDFCNSKLKNENDESKKQQIAYLVERPKRPCGSQKKIIFDLESMKQRKPSVTNSKKNKEKSKTREIDNDEELVNSPLPKLSKGNLSQRYKGQSQPGGNSNIYNDLGKKISSLGIGSLQLKNDNYNGTQQLQHNNRSRQDFTTSTNDTMTWKGKNQGTTTTQIKHFTFKNNQQQQQQQQQQQFSSNQYKTEGEISPKEYQQQYPSSPFQRQIQPRRATNNPNNSENTIPVTVPIVSTQTDIKRESIEINFFIIPDFDLMKVFKVYFPLNNYTKVLKNYEKTKKKKILPLQVQDTFKQKPTTLGNINRPQAISKVSAL